MELPPFRPGLVGGHCIGVDPYYLIQQAQAARHHPELICAARRINEGSERARDRRVLRLMTLREINIADAAACWCSVTSRGRLPGPAQYARARNRRRTANELNAGRRLRPVRRCRRMRA